jgi:hypothetical protein
MILFYFPSAFLLWYDKDMHPQNTVQVFAQLFTKIGKKYPATLQRRVYG